MFNRLHVLLLIAVALWCFVTALAGALVGAWCSVVAALAAAIQHIRAGRIDRRLLAWMAPPSMVGAGVCGLVSGSVPGNALLLAIGATLIVFGVDLLRPGRPGPRPAGPRQHPSGVAHGAPRRAAALARLGQCPDRRRCGDDRAGPRLVDRHHVSVGADELEVLAGQIPLCFV
ncbi:MAG: sulfite exporter TauE/SafE family protein [Actinobacteria bacterium]|nr:MAG: sulfite exporter TauE/SafE family protein [Actinomycetota bacterium]